MNKLVGKIDRKVIKLLELGYEKEIPIYIGEDNIKHMKNKHLEDFNKYRKTYQKYIKRAYIYCKKSKTRFNRIY